MSTRLINAVNPAEPVDETRPKRIQLRRTKGWRKPESAVVVARPSRWGNPYLVADYVDDWPDAGERERRYMATSDFRGWLDGLWERDDDAKRPTDADIALLAGRDLACWCPLDQPCHADVLLKIANVS